MNLHKQLDLPCVTPSMRHTTWCSGTRPLSHHAPMRHASQCTLASRWWAWRLGVTCVQSVERTDQYSRRHRKCSGLWAYNSGTTMDIYGQVYLWAFLPEYSRWTYECVYIYIFMFISIHTYVLQKKSYPCMSGLKDCIPANNHTNQHPSMEREFWIQQLRNVFLQAGPHDQHVSNDDWCAK